MTSLRTRGRQPVVPDELDWRPPANNVDTWDREFRRFRFNTTRVQRKFITHFLFIFLPKLEISAILLFYNSSLFCVFFINFNYEFKIFIIQHFELFPIIE